MEKLCQHVRSCTTLPCAGPLCCPFVLQQGFHQHASSPNSGSSCTGVHLHAIDEPSAVVACCRGHASENPELPETLAAKGIRFLGPPAKAMAALGDKVRTAMHSAVCLGSCL